MFRAPRALVLVIISLAVTSCGSGASSSCANAPIAGGDFLLYPIPNSTSVPDGGFPLLLSWAAQPLILRGTSGPDISLSRTTIPSPLPSPLATPLPQSVYGATLTAYGVPPLAPRTTYNLLWAMPACYGASSPQNAVLGVFTTR